VFPNTDKESGMTDQIGIEVMLQELKDIEALKQLKARYCHLVDAADWDALDTLWTEDAVCDYGFFGRYEGWARNRMWKIPSDD